MKWCNLFLMWCDDICDDEICDDEAYELCDGDCLCCDEMEEEGR